MGEQPGQYDPRDELIAQLRRGSMVNLRPQLSQPGGRYRVISVRAGRAKLKRGNGDPITLSVDKLRGLIEFTGVPEGGDGVLRVMGYRVGRSGRSARARRGVLEDLVFLPRDQLPQAVGVDDWGDAESFQRLGKIMRNLHTFAENARGQSGKQEAVADWLSDLEWFKDRFRKEISKSNPLWDSST